MVAASRNVEDERGPKCVFECVVGVPHLASATVTYVFATYDEGVYRPSARSPQRHQRPYASRLSEVLMLRNALCSCPVAPLPRRSTALICCSPRFTNIRVTVESLSGKLKENLRQCNQELRQAREERTVSFRGTW